MSAFILQFIFLICQYFFRLKLIKSSHRRIHGSLSGSRLDANVTGELSLQRIETIPSASKVM